MFCLAILFFSLFATVNSSVNPAQSNYVKKIQIENNGKKYINPYAFFEMDFTMETLNVQDFKFKAGKDDHDLIPITMYLSTSSPSTKVICDASMNKMKCKAPGYDTIAIELELKDHTVKLYGGYNEEGLSFIQEDSKYLLKISSNFTPRIDKILCPFLMEWPPSVTLQESQEQVTEIQKI